MFKTKALIFLIITGIFFFVFLVLEGTGYYIGIKKNSQWKTNSMQNAVKEKNSAKFEQKNNILKKEIGKFSPRGVYIVIDTANNTLYLKKGVKTLRQAIISCGSGNIIISGRQFSIQESG